MKMNQELQDNLTDAKKEIEILRKFLDPLKTTTDHDVIDSHIRAVAAGILRLHGGLSEVLEEYAKTMVRTSPEQAVGPLTEALNAFDNLITTLDNALEEEIGIRPGPGM